ncbi:hypothetical protein [Lewinella sp. JB7]|uniref:hypothetical protein n=1 Tax=Lewinella sp. JB7 TaxID=2962887 RepID=UPI0020C97DB8|nr:hypothetical protein [Lewinella sp. JB7]MCP9237173.1 hypothetical protein [Lewinella sp. JB7]
MPDSHHLTDDEYQRLLDQDNADDPGDPWRVGPRVPDPEPIGPIRLVPELPRRHRLVQSDRIWPTEAPQPLCRCCYRPRPVCICASTL